MSVWGCLRVSFEMCREGCHCSSVSLPVKTIREQSQGGRSVKSAGEEDGWEQERMRDSKAVAGRELKNCFRRYTLCLVPRCSTWQWTQSTLMEWDGVLTMIEKKNPNSWSISQLWDTHPHLKRDKGLCEGTRIHYFINNETQTHKDTDANTEIPARQESNILFRDSWIHTNAVMSSSSFAYTQAGSPMCIHPTQTLTG